MPHVRNNYVFTCKKYHNTIKKNYIYTWGKMFKTTSRYAYICMPHVKIVMFLHVKYISKTIKKLYLNFKEKCLKQHLDVNNYV